MKYKHIEASREARLWIGQVVVPVVGTIAILMTNPQTKAAILDKAYAAKIFVKNKFGL